MSKQDEYLDSAAQTVELATRTSSSGDKSHLLDLAEKWLDLADRSRQQATHPRSEHPLVKRAFPGSSIELSFTAEPLAVVHFVIVATETTGEQMFVRLLEPGCTESPACQCGAEMKIATIETLPEGTDAAVRVYRCSACHREMRLTVWAAIAPQTEECFFSV